MTEELILFIWVNFVSWLMALSFFASNTLEIFHFCRCNGWTDKANVIKLCQFATALIILDKNLDILNILEFHVAQIDWIAGQIFWINANSNERKNWMSKKEEEEEKKSQ